MVKSTANFYQVVQVLRVWYKLSLYLKSLPNLKIVYSNGYSLADFKRDVCEELVQPYLDLKNNKSNSNDDEEIVNKKRKIDSG